MNLVGSNFPRDMYGDSSKLNLTSKISVNLFDECTRQQSIDQSTKCTVCKFRCPLIKTFGKAAGQRLFKVALWATSQN